MQIRLSTNLEKFIKINIFAFEMLKQVWPAELVKQDHFLWFDGGHHKPSAEYWCERFFRYVVQPKEQIPVGLDHIDLRDFGSCFCPVDLEVSECVANIHDCYVAHLRARYFDSQEGPVNIDIEQTQQ